MLPPFRPVINEPLFEKRSVEVLGSVRKADEDDRLNAIKLSVARVSNLDSVSLILSRANGRELRVTYTDATKAFRMLVVFFYEDSEGVHLVDLYEV